MNPSITVVNTTTPRVTIKNHKTITTSQDVSSFFNKRHDDVLKKIRNLDCSQEFSARNFAEAEYIDEQGKPRPMYEMTKDGFVFLVMGFTGKKAAQFKEAYIAEFNRMEAELYGNKITPDITQEEKDAYNINVLAKHFDVIHQSWKNELYPILRKLESPIAGHLYDSFQYCGVFIKNLQQSLNSKLTSNQTPRLY
ncbi:Rha family transcriptional regulator [uncultured Providencia sp.]|uniref:Rha family transcriptional regulator n=1 Tax=uncultured Providencia sp. TaxID=390517 RepID=UPI00280524B5|nr:Rha family transcriptional regulator [uncultured Providencia sp.]